MENLDIRQRLVRAAFVAPLRAHVLPGARERLFSAEVFFGLTGCIQESTVMRSTESADTCPNDYQMSINKYLRHVNRGTSIHSQLRTCHR